MLTSARLENVARAVVAVKGWHSVEKTEINRNYQKSDLHQIIRILKNYGFLREPQMELFKVKYDASGNQLGSAVVVTRWGGALPPAKY